MAKHTFTDLDGDVWTAEIDPEIPTLMDIKMNDSEDTSLCIRTDCAGSLANIILLAAKDGEQ